MRRTRSGVWRTACPMTSSATSCEGISSSSVQGVVIGSRRWMVCLLLLLSLPLYISLFFPLLSPLPSLAIPVNVFIGCNHMTCNCEYQFCYKYDLHPPFSFFLLFFFSFFLTLEAGVEENIQNAAVEMMEAIQRMRRMMRMMSIELM